MRFLSIFGVTLWLASEALAHKPTVTTFTFHKDIYPIFSEKCGGCHRAGGVAPMSLLSYREAYPWAVAIKNEVLSLSMPPSFADERYGVFKHDGGLTPTELDTIVDWCLGGSPEGDAVATRGETEPSGWTLGPPDQVFPMQAPVALGADENERRVRVSVGRTTSAAILRAFDLSPGAPKVVRSALVFAADRLIGSWTPGSAPEGFPAGAGLSLPAGTELTLEIQYRKTWLDEGAAVEDKSALGLYFQRAEETGGRIEPVSVNGEPLALEVAGELIALLPTIDASGEDFVAEVVTADGERAPLLRLHRPNPDFPRTYWLEEPLLLPGGARIEASHPVVLSLLRP